MAGLLRHARAALRRVVALLRRDRGRNGFEPLSPVPRRVGVVLVAAARDEALLASAAALRRLGARITRYDSDGGALEARRLPEDLAAVIHLQATEERPNETRLDVESDASDSRGVFRQFRAELTRPEGPLTRPEGPR